MTTGPSKSLGDPMVLDTRGQIEATGLESTNPKAQNYSTGDQRKAHSRFEGVMQLVFTSTFFWWSVDQRMKTSLKPLRPIAVHLPSMICQKDRWMYQRQHLITALHPCSTLSRAITFWRGNRLLLGWFHQQRRRLLPQQGHLTNLDGLKPSCLASGAPIPWILAQLDSLVSKFVPYGGWDLPPATHSKFPTYRASCYSMLIFLLTP